MEKIDNKFKLIKLKIDLKHYNRLLDEIIDWDKYILGVIWK
jgi:hypothetical protein